MSKYPISPWISRPEDRAAGGARRQGAGSGFCRAVSARAPALPAGSIRCRTYWPAIACVRVVDAVGCGPRGRGRAIIWGLGGHVIKCGLAPVLIDLMQRGYATAFAMNGAAAIHDFEIALAGHTSEDVEAVLPDGRFGAAEETGREMNAAIAAGARDALGMGEALGRALEAIADPAFASASLVLEAGGRRFRLRCTWPSARTRPTPIRPRTPPQSAARRIAISVCSARCWPAARGGVYLNVGSAVVLPEVFLKAVSAVRNLGHPLAEIHHREPGFPAALPSAGKRGGTASRASGRRRLSRSQGITS